jgi:hypothetical protein
MDTTIEVGLLQAAVSMVGFCVNIYLTVRTDQKAGQAVTQGARNETIATTHAAKLQEIETQINSKMTAALATTKREGELQGRSDLTAELNQQKTVDATHETRIAMRVIQMLKKQGEKY